jgi:uncharacterized protein YndB with AHSA1/START domain
MGFLRLLPVLSLLLVVSARADVKRSADYALTIEHKLSTAVAAADLFRAIDQVEKWWSSRHTRSGSAANLSLEAEAGACFCEKWRDGSVEHGRVIHVERDRLLRLQAALGPLQEMAVAAVLSFALEPKAGGTTITVSYRVTGDQTHGLRSLSGPVDRVIGEQAARLVRFAETGKPE